MKIMSNHQIFSQERMGGISRYFTKYPAGFHPWPVMLSRFLRLYTSMSTVVTPSFSGPQRSILAKFL